MIKFKGYSNFHDIKESFLQIYGEGYQSNQYIDYYLWLGSDVDISLDYSDITKKGTIIFSYKPLAEERKTDKLKESRKAKDDL